MARLFRRIFGVVSRSWHMYPIGFLFGLGFDTATEVALLGISATQATQGLSFWAILIFPALFTAGMTLLDTTDSVLMTGAYGWALANPVRKLWYNLTITAASATVALFIGGLEGLRLIGEQARAHGWTVASGEHTQRQSGRGRLRRRRHLRRGVDSLGHHLPRQRVRPARTRSVSALLRDGAPPSAAELPSQRGTAVYWPQEYFVALQQGD